MVTCTYRTGTHTFTESYAFPSAEDEDEDWDWDRPEVTAAVRILRWPAASYYKTSAPPVIDLGTTTSTPEERAFLLSYYRNGLAEFAYRTGIDLSDPRGDRTGRRRRRRRPRQAEQPQHVDRADRARRTWPPSSSPSAVASTSIVTVEALAPQHPGRQVSFVVHPPSTSVVAVIEDAAAKTGLLDPPRRPHPRSAGPPLNRARLPQRSRPGHGHHHGGGDGRRRPHPPRCADPLERMVRLRSLRWSTAVTRSTTSGRRARSSRWRSPAS